MDDDSLLKLDNQLCFAVYACARELTKLYHPLLKDLGLTYTQYIALLVLWEERRSTVKELGRRLYLDSGTLTPLLKKLENMGLLTRTRDPRDERSVIVELTEEGLGLKEKALTVPERLFCKIGVSPEEAIALRSGIGGLLRQVQRIGTEPPNTKTDPVHGR